MSEPLPSTPAATPPASSSIEIASVVASNLAYAAMCAGVLLTLFPGLRQRVRYAAAYQLYLWRQGLASLTPDLRPAWQRDLDQWRT